MKHGISVDTALRDGNLLGSSLGNAASWECWLTVLRAAFALPLNDAQRETFIRIAGGRQPPSRRVSEFWVVSGRRSGKTRTASALCCYIAAIEQHKLAPGEVGYVLLLSASRAQASVAYQYVLSFLEGSPVLRQQIQGVTAEEVRLKGNIIIGVHAGSYRTIRGRTLLAVVGDETSFWRDEASAEPDIEIFRACQPALAASRGMWIGISTGYRKLGLLYQKWRDHFGQDSDDVLVVQGESAQFNPTLDVGMIERAKAADPEASEAEWMGGFRSDLAAYLDDPTVEAAVDYGRPLELPPRAGVSYRAFVDGSGGRHDAYVAAIGHKDEDGRLIVDCVTGHLPPFDPGWTTKELAETVKRYRCNAVTGDAYSAEWMASAWRSNGISYTVSELNKSAIYIEVLPLFTQGLVSLPNHAKLLRELRLLERRTHRSGKDSVDHGRNGSDDFSNATCGLLYGLGRGSKYRYVSDMSWVSDSDSSDNAAERWQQERLRNHILVTGGYYARRWW